MEDQEKARLAACLKQVPGLCDLAAKPRREIIASARLLQLDTGTTVFEPGAPCNNFLLLFAGTVRVHMTTRTGREIVLYRIARGESCILTTSCLMADETYQAAAITESPTQALALPKSVFNRILNECETFRRFVLASYGSRFYDLMVLIQEIAFSNMHKRLAQFLVDRNCDGILQMTHQAIAVELGSAREVVSRLLKEFERKGWIDLARGRIVLADAAALRAFLDRARRQDGEGRENMHRV